MNHVCFEDSSDKIDTAGLENVMKSFNFSLYLNSSEIKDIFDVQNIMKEGRIEDFMKCIQSILNYSFDTYTSNSSVKILDSSFIKFFHVAQVIIRFLLHWKSELFKENTKLKNQIQELEKLRKDCFSRKLEIKDLKKQLWRYQRSEEEFIPASVSECSQCRKIFVNSTFLYAHHRRRHGDKPFTNVEKENEIKLLKDEICELKQRLNSVNYNEYKKSCPSEEAGDIKMPAAPLKMKIFPELSCLEAQEKFWRGKLKDVYDTFEKEKQSMKNFLDELNAENTRLKQELTYIQSKPPSSSVAVQTTMSTDSADIDRSSRLTHNYERIRNYLSMDSLVSNFTQDREQPTRIPEIRRRTSLPSTSNQILDLPRATSPSSVTRYLRDDLRTNVVDVIPRNIVTEGLLPSGSIDLSPRKSSHTFCGSQESDLFDNLHPAFPITAPRRLDSDYPTVAEDAPSDDSTQQDETDIIEQVNSFLANYQHQRSKMNDVIVSTKTSNPSDEERHDEEKKVIMKFFTTEQLADKLIKIYDKRRSLVSDVDEPDERAVGEDKPEDTNTYITGQISSATEVASSVKLNDVPNCDGVRESNEDRRPENRSHSNSYRSEVNVSTLISGVCVEDDTATIATLLPPAKEKSKFLPFFRNIPSKFVKNYSKSRKMCVDIIESKIMRKMPTRSRDEAGIGTEKHDGSSLRFEVAPDGTMEPESTPDGFLVDVHPHTQVQVQHHERKLVSALKKSKSTGNITKKVAFTDDLPSLNTVSEWDLRKVSHSCNPNPLPSSQAFATVGTVHVHCDRFTKPVPAPRTKKSVIVSNGTDCQ